MPSSHTTLLHDGVIMRKKTYLQELEEEYPTNSKQRHNRLVRANERFNEKKLGKMGAASEVRHIDPLTVDISRYERKIK